MRISDWSSDVCSSDLGVSKELGLDKPSGNRSAVQRKYRVLAAGAPSVDLADNKLLPGPCLAGHYHRAIVRSQPLHLAFESLCEYGRRSRHQLFLYNFNKDTLTKSTIDYVEDPTRQTNVVNPVTNTYH